MRFSLARIRTAAAIASLALTAPAVFAQTSPIPAPANSTGSGVIVSIWDTTKAVSLVAYLGVGGNAFNFSDASVANLTPSSGLTINFDTLTDFGTTFAGSNPANLVYTVYAGKSSGAATTQTFLTTGPLSGGLGTPPIPNNGNVTAINTAGNSFFGSVNAACPSTPSCRSDGSLALNTAAFAGGTNWGDTYNGGLTQASAAGAVGTALGFYSVTKTGSTATTGANVVQYANTAGVGQFFLTTDGHLSYTIPAGVPLPAAGWLLLSGLAGVMSIRRRRTGAA